MSRPRSRNPVITCIELVTVLVLIIVAIKKLMEWMKEKELTGGVVKQGMMDGVIQMANMVKTEVRGEPEKLQKQVKPARVVTPTAPKAQPLNLSPRQEKIYNMIRAEGQMTMPTLTKELPQVSSRTLRRDMLVLEKLGLLVQTGRTKNSVYKLIR